MRENDTIYKMTDSKFPSEYYVSEPNSEYDADRDFTTLIAWQNAHDVKLFFYKKIVPKLPAVEKYKMNNHLSSIYIISL